VAARENVHTHAGEGILGRSEALLLDGVRCRLSSFEENSSL